MNLHRDYLALVGIVTRQYHVEPKISNSISDMRFFPSRKPSHKFWNQISFVVIEYQNLFLAANRSEHEADLSPPSSDVVKNEWNCTSTYSYVSILCTGDFFLYFTLLRTSECTESMVQDVVHLSAVLNGIDFTNKLLNADFNHYFSHEVENQTSVL